MSSKYLDISFHTCRIHDRKQSFICKKKKGFRKQIHWKYFLGEKSEVIATTFICQKIFKIKICAIHLLDDTGKEGSITIM